MGVVDKALSSDELLEIEKRADAATVGPWYVDHRLSVLSVELPGHCFEWETFACVCTEQQEKNDAEFIAHAREDIPRLLATIRQLMAE